MIEFDPTSILGLAPPALTALLALVIVVVDLARPARANLVTYVGAIGVVLIMAATVVIGPLPNNIGLLGGSNEIFGGVYVRDPLTCFLDLLLLSIALLTLLFGPDY